MAEFSKCEFYLEWGGYKATSGHYVSCEEIFSSDIFVEDREVLRWLIIGCEGRQQSIGAQGSLRTSKTVKWRTRISPQNIHK